MSSEPVLGIVVGPPALGVRGEAYSFDAVTVSARQAGFIPRALHLDQPDRLDELWGVDAVIMLCDGAYPEIGGAITLSALHQWCTSGGVLIDTAACAFLLAAEPSGLNPAIRTFIDVFERVVDYNCTDRRIELTRQGHDCLGTDPFASSLLELNRGSDRRATLNAIPQPNNAYVVTSSGACVLGEYAVESGWLIRWAASSCGMESDRVRDCLLSLARRKTETPLARTPPPAVIGQLLQTRGSRDCLSLWTSTSAGQPCAVTVDGVPAHPSRTVDERHHLHTFVPLDRVDVAADACATFSNSVPVVAVVMSDRAEQLPALPVAPAPRVPDDLEDFWADQRRNDHVRWRTDLISTVSARSSAVNLKQVSCALPDGRYARGTLCEPSHGTEQPRRRRPAILVLPGYACAGDEEVPERLSEQGVIGLSIGLGETAECGTTTTGLLTDHPNDRTLFGYRRAVLLCLAAIDFLASMADVDGDRIGILGASQGAASLSSRPHSTIESRLLHRSCRSYATSSDPSKSSQRNLPPSYTAGSQPTQLRRQPGALRRSTTTTQPTSHIWSGFLRSSCTARKTSWYILKRSAHSLRVSDRTTRA